MHQSITYYSILKCYVEIHYIYNKTQNKCKLDGEVTHLACPEQLKAAEINVNDYTDSENLNGIGLNFNVESRQDVQPELIQSATHSGRAINV